MAVPPWGRRADRTLVAVLAATALVAAFYVWTGATSAETLRPGGQQVDPFNALTDAFLAGQTHLTYDPPAGLLRLRDPYDPKQHKRFFHRKTPDLSLYKGRYYTYWGPAPALVAFAPFRVLGLGDLPEGLACLLFALVALAYSVALLVLLARRLAPRAPPWTLALAVIVLGTANVAPFLVRTSRVYEVAIISAQAFLMPGLYLLASALLRDTVRLRALAGASLLLGLAFGSRPPLGLAGALLVGVLVLLRRRGLRGPGVVAALLAPFGACVVAYAAYNAVRFGSPAEFGQRFQIAGADFRNAFGGVQNLLPNLWSYVVVPPLARLAFPFFWLSPPPDYPGPIPAHYVIYEPLLGLVPGAPVVLGALGLRRVIPRGLVRTMLLASVGLGAALLLFLCVYLNGAALRYATDFATLVLIPALLVGIVALTRTRRRTTRRRVLAVTGVFLAGWSVSVSVAASIVGDEGLLRDRHPGTYSALEQFFSPLPTLATQIAGRPMIASVGGDPKYQPVRYDRLGLADFSIEAGLRANLLRIIAPSNEDATLVARVVRRPVAPPGTRLTLRLSNGALGVNGPPVNDQVQRVVVPLHRGINDVRVSVVAEPALPIGPSDYRYGAVVGLDDVRVEAAR